LLTSIALPVVDFPVYAKAPTTLCLTDPTCAKIGYVTQSVYGRIAGTVSFSYDITETGSPTYQYKLNPDNTCENPANVRLFFQSAGSDRWWSNPVAGVLGPGSNVMTAALTGDKWSNVSGQFGTAVPAQFSAAMSYVGAMGVTFGGGCFFGHGVNISGGSSRFTAQSYVIK